MLNLEYIFKTLVILDHFIQTTQNLLSTAKKCTKNYNARRRFQNVNDISDTPVVGFYMFFTKPRLGKQKNVNHVNDERKRRFDQSAEVFNL